MDVSNPFHPCLLLEKLSQLYSNIYHSPNLIDVKFTTRKKIEREKKERKEGRKEGREEGRKEGRKRDK